MFNNCEMHKNEKLSFKKLDRWFLSIENNLRFLLNGKVYVNNWRNLIEEEYENLLKTPQLQINFCTLNYDSQIFEKEITIERQIVYLHFDIDILKNIALNEIRVAQLPISDFSLKNIYPKIMYTKTNRIPVLAKNDFPIIAIPLNLGGAIGCIADGNHRMTAKAFSCSTPVNTYLLTPEQASRSIGSSFEKAVYCFIEDLDQLMLQQRQNPTLKTFNSVFYPLCAHTSI